METQSSGTFLCRRRLSLGSHQPCATSTPAQRAGSIAPLLGLFWFFFIEIESLRTKSVHRMDNLFWEEVIALLTRSSQLYLKPDSAGARVHTAVQSHKGRHYFGENICFLHYFHLAEAGKPTSEALRAGQLGEPRQPRGMGRSCSISGCRQPRRWGA